MREDRGEDRDEGQRSTAETPPMEHDDIMKRLLAYQERLRRDLGGEEPAAGPSPWAVPERTPAEAPPGREPQPVAIATDDLVDVGSAEEAQPPEAPVLLPPAPPRDLEARVADLEATLERVEEVLGDLRQRFQDLAIAADERIAAIRDQVARVRRGRGTS